MYIKYTHTHTHIYNKPRLVHDVIAGWLPGFPNLLVPTYRIKSSLILRFSCTCVKMASLIVRRNFHPLFTTVQFCTVPIRNPNPNPNPNPNQTKPKSRPNPNPNPNLSPSPNPNPNSNPNPKPTKSSPNLAQIQIQIQIQIQSKPKHKSKPKPKENHVKSAQGHTSPSHQSTPRSTPSPSRQSQSRFPARPPSLSYNYSYRGQCTKRERRFESNLVFTFS